MGYLTSGEIWDRVMDDWEWIGCMRSWEDGLEV